MTTDPTYAPKSPLSEADAPVEDWSMCCILPVAGSAEGLVETISSLRRQSWAQWTCFMVLGNDCTPLVQATAETLAAENSRLEVIRSKFSTRAHLGNVGLKHAKAAWMLVLRTGDVLREDFFSAIQDRLNRNRQLDAFWCQTATAPVTEHFVRTGRPRNAMDDLFPMFARQPFFLLNCCVFRRSLTSYAGEFDPDFELLEDWDLLQRISRCGAGFGLVGEAMVFPGPLNANLDLNRLRKEGFQIIRRGCESDRRVKYPDPLYREGVQEGNLADLEFLFSGFLDGLQLGKRMPGTLMLELAGPGTQIEINPAELAQEVLMGMLWVLPPEEANASAWWEGYHASFCEMASHLEARMGIPLLAYRMVHAFEQLLIRAEGWGSSQIGHWQKVTLNLEAVIKDVYCVPEVHNCLFELRYGETYLGHLELPAIAGLVSAYVIEDAVVDRFAWQLLNIFFVRTLYNELTVLDAGGGSFTVLRGNLVLCKGLNDSDPTSSEFHDRIGWSLFLQEIWGEPGLSENAFYAGASAISDARPDIVRATADEVCALQVADAINDLGKADRSVRTVVFLGATPLGSVLIDSNHGRINREVLRAGITCHFGFELCKVAVREGLLAHPILDGRPLRKRLHQQAERFNLGTGALDAVTDISKHLRENYAKNVLHPRYPATLCERLLPRLNHELIGQTSSRRGALPLTAETEAELRQSNGGESIDDGVPSTTPQKRIIYAPEVLDLLRPGSIPLCRQSPALNLPEDKKSDSFEILFRARRDPWGYANPYETRKFEQTLEIIPERRYACALDLACAEGHFTKLLAGRVEKLVAADISETALQRAAVRCGNMEKIEFRQLDMTKDQFGGRYDLIVCSEALYYTEDEATLSRVVQKIAEALAPGGFFVAAHANLVVDDPQQAGFDWDQPFGGRRIGEIIAAHTGLRLAREIRTPFYRIQRFERMRSWLGWQPQPAAEITVMSQPVPLPPALGRRALWKGGHPKRGIEVQAKRSPGLPILAYHQVSDFGPPALNRYRVTPAAFEEHLRCLKAAGFYSITLCEWCLAAVARKPLKGKPCVISFDDGYLDFATNAWPLLKKHGFSATVFLVSQQIGKDSAWDARFGPTMPLMSWSEVLHHEAEGVEFGSHSMSHRPMTGLNPNEIFREALQSRMVLQKELKSIISLAYPYGDWDATVRHAVGACGYWCGLTCNTGFAQMQSDLLALPRVLITAVDGLNEFATKLKL